MASKLMVSRQQAQDFLDFASMVREATETITEPKSPLVQTVVKYLKAEMKGTPTYREFRKEADYMFGYIAEEMVHNFSLGFAHNRGERQVNDLMEDMLNDIADLDEDEFIDTLTELKNMA